MGNTYKYILQKVKLYQLVMNEQVALLNQLLENFFILGGEDFDKM